MKLLTFVRPEDHSPCLGVLHPGSGRVLDVDGAVRVLEGRGSPHLQSMTAWLTGGDAARRHVELLLAEAEEEDPESVWCSLESVQLLAPVPRPHSIRDCLGFERHLSQSTRTVAKWRFRPAVHLDRALRLLGGRGFLNSPRVVTQQPIYYKGNAASVIGHGAEVPWPDYTERLDYELEYGVYIGKEGRDIPEHEAHDFIGGFTIFNDFSARDAQLQEMPGRLGPAKGKDFDRGNAMGPYLVTPDEVPDPAALRMTVRVNGELWSDTTSREMLFSWSAIIAYISRQETLYPGDFIGSGTAPHGCGLEWDRWLTPGSIVELEVERLGVLRNSIGLRGTSG